jgi:hypothetical protein
MVLKIEFPPFAPASQLPPLAPAPPPPTVKAKVVFGVQLNPVAVL